SYNVPSELHRNNKHCPIRVCRSLPLDDCTNGSSSLVSSFLAKCIYLERILSSRRERWCFAAYLERLKEHTSVPNTAVVSEGLLGSPDAFYEEWKTLPTLHHVETFDDGAFVLMLVLPSSLPTRPLVQDPLTIDDTMGSQHCSSEW
ncbi:hypothetical protein PIIN_10994, partial [Serendipita indica DSM 11827]